MTTKIPNYLKAILKAAAEGKYPTQAGLYVLDVLHDDWCQIWTGGVCNCQPDLTLVSPNWKLLHDRHEGTAS